MRMLPSTKFALATVVSSISDDLLYYFKNGSLQDKATLALLGELIEQTKKSLKSEKIESEYLQSIELSLLVYVDHSWPWAIGSSTDMIAEHRAKCLKELVRDIEYVYITIRGGRHFATAEELVIFKKVADFFQFFSINIVNMMCDEDLPPPT